MARHNDFGKEGEQRAIKLLQDNGYAILESNWTFGKAEVDVIARKENILAAVEVKTRSGTDFGLPQDFVNQKKIRLLVNAVHAYADKIAFEGDIRFDIVSVLHKDGCWRVEHIPDAFYHF